MNSVGYGLLREKHVPEAVNLFLLNVKLTPTSWNAYDSLGEAYTLAGDTTQAIANYEKSPSTCSIISGAPEPKSIRKRPR